MVFHLIRSGCKIKKIIHLIPGLLILTPSCKDCDATSATVYSERGNSYAFARRREYAFREAKLKNQQFKEKVSKYKHCLGFVRSMGCLFTLSFCLQTLRRCHAMIRSKRWELLRGLFLEERVKGLVVVPDI